MSDSEMLKKRQYVTYIYGAKIRGTPVDRMSDGQILAIYNNLVHRGITRPVNRNAADKPKYEQLSFL